MVTMATGMACFVLLVLPLACTMAAPPAMDPLHTSTATLESAKETQDTLGQCLNQECNAEGTTPTTGTTNDSGGPSTVPADSMDVAASSATGDDKPYTAAYHTVTCAPSVFETPSTTQEVAGVVAKYYKVAQSGTAVTMRVSRPDFHSTADYVCPISPAQDQPIPCRTASDTSGQNVTGPAAETCSNTDAGAGSCTMPTAAEVGLMQSKLNKVLALDTEKQTVRVGAGTTFGELLEVATSNGLSVQLGTVPMYAGLTVGGVLATSAHGSGHMSLSTFADSVLEVTWVDGTGQIRVSTKADPEFAAFKGSLGVFGVMTELLLQLTPTTYTELITVQQDDADMAAKIEALLKVSPHGTILWRPDAGRFNAYLLRPAQPNATVNDDPAIEMSAIASTEGEPSQNKPFELLSTTSQDDSSFFGVFCPALKQQMLGTAWVSVGKGATAKKLANVTAPTNKMLAAAECGEFCFWTNANLMHATLMDVEFTIEFDQLADWLTDVKAIFQKDLLEDGAKGYRCMGPGVIWVRFGAPCEGLTATPCGLRRPVYVQSTWFRSRDGPGFPLRYQFVADLIEELTLCKYKGRPHWGKNSDRTFLHPRCPITSLYPKFNTLLSLAKQYDPQGMLKPRLFDRMVAEDSFDTFPECAPQMQCYCSDDVHCRPGDKCVASLAFPDFKVCKPADGEDSPGSILQHLMPPTE